jgi:hypothetical protein
VRAPGLQIPAKGQEDVVGRVPHAASPVYLTISQFLTDRQQQLLDAVIAAPDIQAAVKAVGVGRTTAYARLTFPSNASP